MTRTVAHYQSIKHSNKSSKILFIEPVFKHMIWGGSRLKTDFRYEIAGEQIGECWTVSAHPKGDCKVHTVNYTSPYDGLLLSELWANHKELFGGMPGDKFPLLIKIIDAKKDLSIQVHPDDTYASDNEMETFGKTESWYVLDCNSETQIIVGHNARTKEELMKMIEDKKWSDLIRVHDIHAGDFFHIEPGMVHAIKAGTMILEIQQNSDLTYRLYDYGRLENGKPRELHIKKSVDVITCPYRKPPENRVLNRKQLAQGIYKEKLMHCSYYDIERIVINGSYSFSQKEPFTILGVINGKGMIDGIPIKKGDFFILTNDYGKYSLTGTLEMIKVIS